MTNSTQPTRKGQSVVRDLTAAPRAYRVAAGWHVHDWAGELVGEVIDRDIDSMTVRVDGSDAFHARIPTRLIVEEDEPRQRATLAVEADQLEGLRPLRGASER